MRVSSGSLKPFHHVSRGGGPAVGTRETIVGALWNGCNSIAGGRYFGPTAQPTSRAKAEMQIYAAGFAVVLAALVASKGDLHQAPHNSSVKVVALIGLFVTSVILYIAYRCVTTVKDAGILWSFLALNCVKSSKELDEWIVKGRGDLAASMKRRRLTQR